MKIIRVQDQLEGGKVAFSLLKESLAKGATTLGLANRQHTDYLLSGAG